MKQLWLTVEEVTLLFAALFFTPPYVPSHGMERLPLFPGAALAVLPFAASRVLRSRRFGVAALAETVAFALFAWGSNQAANLLYGL